jgi:hypothetical protein
MTEQEQKCESNSKRMTLLSIRRFVKMMKARKYVVYTEPYKLNIVGVRNANTNPEQFDDDMFVFWKNENGIWKGRKYKMTTDPSTSALFQMKNQKGVAILPTGQYIDTWKVRPHRNKYIALGQQRKLCVYRDYNRDALLNFDINSKDCSRIFGINIHRAKYGDADDGQGNTKVIGAYSEGCQVFQNYYCFQEFMNMAYRQKDLYGNNFTYTLFDFSLRRKFQIKRTIYTVMMGVGLYLLIP